MDIITQGKNFGEHGDIKDKPIKISRHKRDHTEPYNRAIDANKTLREKT